MNEEVYDIQEGNVPVLFVGLDPVIHYRLKDIKDTRIAIKSTPDHISCKTTEWHPIPDNGNFLQVRNYTLTNMMYSHNYATLPAWHSCPVAPPQTVWWGRPPHSAEPRHWVACRAGVQAVPSPPETSVAFYYSPGNNRRHSQFEHEKIRQSLCVNLGWTEQV